MSETPTPAAALATALRELLVGSRATDGEGVAPAVVLAVIDPATGARHTVALQPESADWLTGLTVNSRASCGNAYGGGNGRCAHCRGTGRAGTAAPGRG
ncbi:hypothetical protein GXW83_21745 [Streptacidiphilus sp. PB12-B1b]|uniref:hypothetical protein n=1 Tax=Streptacidiphilus sp. PB12-B1b TaxID=2705012 RepID=UPI0015FC3465|nr:hypothetical protein [Streptacidiphilus sp. PB12-B1b]QMU77926.1 hypothetical protein GXW83_21745 [Streptacidiphilus sp. PB12-B1b]